MTVTAALDLLPGHPATTVPPTLSSLRAQRESACREQLVLARRAFFGLTIRLAVLPVVLGFGAWGTFEAGAGAPVTIASAFWWWIMSRARARWATHLRTARGLAQPSAEEVLADWTGPTVLFLRGFDRERDAERIVGHNREFSSSDVGVDARLVEAVLSRALAPIPLLALPDPRRLDALPGARRFATVPVTWDEFVADLICRTDIVVLYVHDVTPGVEREVALLREAGALQRTLVVLETNGDEMQTARVGALVADMPHGVTFARGAQKEQLTHFTEMLGRAFGALQGGERVALSGAVLRHAAGELERLHHPPLPRRVGQFLLGPLIAAGGFGVLLGVVGVLYVAGVVIFLLALAISAWQWQPVGPRLMELGREVRSGAYALAIGFPALTAVLVFAKWLMMGWSKGSELGERGVNRIAALFRPRPGRALK